MNRIKELTAQNNLTLTWLGKEINMSSSRISQYETGKREPKLETWNKLADYFHVPVAYLKGYTVYTCARCGNYFIPEPNTIREQIECCPYCMNPYFEGDK